MPGQFHISFGGEKPQEVEFIFDGWKSDALKSTYHKSVAHWEVEAQAGRTNPSMPKGVLTLWPNAGENDTEGTVIGTLFIARYLPSVVSLDEIIAFLDESPVNMSLRNGDA